MIITVVNTPKNSDNDDDMASLAETDISTNLSIDSSDHEGYQTALDAYLRDVADDLQLDGDYVVENNQRIHIIDWIIRESAKLDD